MVGIVDFHHCHVSDRDRSGVGAWQDWHYIQTLSLAARSTCRQTAVAGVLADIGLQP